MAIEGSLEDVSLADICQLLALGQKTGCLSITDRSNFGYIYFDQGRVIYASVLNRPDRLGELLVRNDVISRQDLSRAMETQSHEQETRLGQILVRDGALTEEQLHRYIRLQIEEAVYHLFTWTQGSFHFDPDQRPDEEGLFLVSIPAENLLLEGARRVDEWSLIEKKIPSMDLVFDMVKDPSEESGEVELTPQQKKVLPLTDGTRTVAEIIREAGMVEFEVGKALFGLIQAGFVDRADVGVSRDDGTGDEELKQHLNLGLAFYRSGMLDDAVRELEAALQIDPESIRALHRLAMVALRRGRPEEALEILARLPEELADGYGVLRNRSLALERMGRYDEALNVLDRAAQLHPGEPGTDLARGVIHVLRGQADAATEALDAYRTHESVKTPSPLYFAYAVLAEGMRGDLDRAEAVGREGLHHYPTSGPVLVNTGAVIERQGAMGEASSLFSKAVSEGRPPAQAHKNLGDHAFARGDLVAARVHYEKAVKVAPGLGDDVYLRLGTIAHNDEDLDSARLLWRRALEINPSNELVRSNLESLDGGG
jgi:tetratricopeptide (TPR) repeat protein